MLPERAAELTRWGCPANAIGLFGTLHVRTPSYCGDAEMLLWLPPGPPVAVGHAPRLAIVSQGSGLQSRLCPSVCQC